MEVLVSVKREGLQNLLRGGTETAENFFGKIMKETGTEIVWPSQLKTGSKSRKDPSVKIWGSPEAVQSAREKITKILDPKPNRVIMKMDVSYTHHSHLIGKSGKNVKTIMEEHQCHIHFPDSNRLSQAEKSNQVSITGDPLNVETARSRIRDLLPVIIQFELPPPVGLFLPLPDASQPVFKLFESAFGISISFHQPKQNGSIIVQVKCGQQQFPNHKYGILLLMEYLTGKKMIELPVVIQMEVLSQSQTFVTGANVNRISHETGAKIIFPSSAALNGSNLENRSTVSIWGTVDNAYAAWLQLMSCLPLALIFDLKEGEDLDTAKSAILRNNVPSSVSILLKHKPKKKIKTVIMRGSEHDSRVLLMIRQQLLQLEPLDFPPDKNEIDVASHLISHPTEPCFTQALNVSDVCAWSWSVIEHLNSLVSTVGYPLWHPHMNHSHREHCSLFHQPSDRLSTSPQSLRSGWSLRSQFSEIPNSPQRNDDASDVTPSLIKETNGWNFKEFDSWSSPKFFTDNHRLLESEENNNFLPRQSPNTSSFRKDTHEEDFHVNNFSKKDLGFIGCERNAGQISSDYDYKKELATKAMQRQIECAQVPSGSWAGYGFSQSMPTSVIKQKFEENRLCHDSFLQGSNAERWQSNRSTLNWPSSNFDIPEVDSVFSRDNIFSCSNYFDGARPAQNFPVSSDMDLPQLLCRSGLTNYVDLFNQQEVDLPAFLTMSDQDLQDLGIPYGARRKMSCIISGWR